MAIFVCLYRVAMLASGGPQEGGHGIFSGYYAEAFWTVVAFVVLLVVLGRFAWSPLLAGLKAREERIRQQLEAAEQVNRQAQQVLQYLQRYHDLQDIIAILGLDELSREDQVVVARARRLERFFSQPFVVTKQFTGLEGRYVQVSDTIASCKAICEGKGDDLPEEAFMYVGTFEEAQQKAAVLARR